MAEERSDKPSVKVRGILPAVSSVRRLLIRALLTAALAGLLSSNAPAQQEPVRSVEPSILSGDLRSPERRAPIEAHKARAPELAARFTYHTYKSADGEFMPYRLFTPNDPEKGRRYPLVVFLHGSSGSGTDNEKQLQGASMFGGLIWAADENQKRHPCYIVAPQSDVNWPCVTLHEGERPKLCPGLGRGAKSAFGIVDKLLAEEPIDPARIYVTGHSMGGAGTWHMIAQRPDFFAAAVPVCGLPDRSTAASLKDIPIWNFHGEVDDIEPVETSRLMIEAIRKAEGHPAYTEYPGVGHNVFLWAYTEPALVEWLFSQHLERAEPKKAPPGP